MHHSSALSIVLIILAVGFGMYRRVRRTVGRQEIIPRRLWVRAIILGVVGLLFISRGVGHPSIWLYEAGGLVIGLVFTYFVTRSTTFEQGESQIYYRTNLWLGIAVLVLFVGRLAYRFIEIYSVSQHMPLQAGTNGQANFSSAYTADPWTAGIYFILCTYYVVFSAFLLYQRTRMIRSVPAQ